MLHLQGGVQVPGIALALGWVRSLAPCSGGVLLPPAFLFLGGPRLRRVSGPAASLKGGRQTDLNTRLHHHCHPPPPPTSIITRWILSICQSLCPELYVNWVILFLNLQNKAKQGSRGRARTVAHASLTPDLGLLKAHRAAFKQDTWGEAQDLYPTRFTTDRNRTAWDLLVPLKAYKASSSPPARRSCCGTGFWELLDKFYKAGDLAGRHFILPFEINEAKREGCQFRLLY